MSLQHRGGRVPFRTWLTCRMYGHQEPLARLSFGRVMCPRCERVARTPVELP